MFLFIFFFVMRRRTRRSTGSDTHFPYTTLFRSKPKHLIQRGVYAAILTREQGTAPERMHVVLGDGTVATVGVSSIIHYFRVAQERFLEYVGAPPAESAGPPRDIGRASRGDRVCQYV